jgi:hypothetical protein
VVKEMQESLLSAFWAVYRLELLGNFTIWLFTETYSSFNARIQRHQNYYQLLIITVRKPIKSLLARHTHHPIKDVN